MNVDPVSVNGGSVDAAACPFEVRRAVMRHRWATLTFLHWSFPVDDVQRLLPSGLQVHSGDGLAWVGLVPFAMEVEVPPFGSVPWLTRFCETNVRTYVRDAHGRVGIWFFSLDAARLGAVLAARATYRLPYFWSAMRLRVDGTRVSYECRRRWPGPRGATSKVLIEVGDPYKADDLTALDHFLTARWILFSSAGHYQRFARASHAPWALRRAQALEVDDSLVQAAGLPAPMGAPLVHYSPGVRVRIGRPQRGGSA